jgi:chromosome segregation ATPase
MNIEEKENLILSEVTKNTLYSIKEKLNIFEDQAEKISDETNTNLQDVNKFKTQIEEFSVNLKQRPHLIHRQATNDCEDKEEQINRHLTHQKAENGRMNKELDLLKDEHLSLYQAIHQCQKKLKELETRIGFNIPIE